MYKTALVKTDIEDGRRVIDEIEKIIPITAAFWFYREEDDEWKLVVVSPGVEAKGPIDLYTKIALLLNDLAVDSHRPVTMPLTRITMTSTHHPTYLRIKRFGDAFNDAYIYKMS